MMVLLSIYCIQASHANEGTVSDSTNPTNYYRTLTLGLSNSTYRDFATSPLFYSGGGGVIQTSWIKRSAKKERAFVMNLNINSVNARVPKSDYLQPNTSAIFSQINMKYLRLWEVNTNFGNRNNLKIGGVVQSSQNIRLNISLENNALGFENISNIMASGQITRDISRKTERRLNLWLIKPKLKPIKRDLRFQLNAGLLNMNYRPSYNYAYHGELIGLETNPLSWLLSNYKWSLNGWRFNTELEYITYLPNGNATSWAYVWDAAHAPGRFENFQMASHQIRYTYYFNTKTR
jgi:hypothetical protein